MPPLPTLWPYLFILPAVLLGALFGWQLNAARARRAGRSDGAAGGVDDPSLVARHTNADEARLEADGLDRSLATLNEAITASRQQYHALQDEHQKLLLNIEAKRGEVEKAQQSLQEFGSEQSSMLVNIDASGEELAMLEKLNETYAGRISRLTSDVEGRSAELDRLNKLSEKQKSDIQTLEIQIRRQQAHLTTLNNQIKAADVKIKQAEEASAGRRAQLQQILENQQRAGVRTDVPSAVYSSRFTRRDVTPGERSRLSGRRVKHLPDATDPESDE